MGGILNAYEATSSITLPSISSFTMPAVSTVNLAGLYLFDSGDRTVNWAPGGDQLTPIGAPVIGANSVTLSGANGYETGIAEANDMTVAVITKALVTGGNLIIHNANVAGGAPNGIVLHFGDGGLGSALRAGVKNAGGAYQQAANGTGTGIAGEWNIIVGAYSASEVVAGWSKSGGYSEVSTGVTGGRTLSGSVRIGGAAQSGGAYATDFDVLAAAIYTGVLDATARAALVAAMRAWLIEGGITTA